MKKSWNNCGNNTDCSFEATKVIYCKYVSMWKVFTFSHLLKTFENKVTKEEVLLLPQGFLSLFNNYTFIEWDFSLFLLHVFVFKVVCCRFGWEGVKRVWGWLFPFVSGVLHIQLINQSSLRSVATRESWCNASMSPEIHTAVMHNTNIIVVE